MEKLYCGLDIGTSAVKSVIFNKSFTPVFSATNNYEFVGKRKGRAVLDPEEVYQAVLASLLSCQENVKENEKKIDFISLSSALHSVIAVDKSYTPLTGCITWADTRAMEFNELLQKKNEQSNFYHRTGCPPHAIYMPAKILWLKTHRPEIFAKTYKFITIKEFVLYKLTGNQVVDYSLASGGGLLDIHQKTWDNELLELLNISNESLSDLVNGNTILKLNTQSRKKLKDDIPIVVGSGDGPLANLGAGAYPENKFVVTIGSSGAVRVFSDRPVLDPDNRTWCYMLDEEVYLPGGAINNGGIILEWLRKELFNLPEDEFYRVADNNIKDVFPGSRGLLFLPFLTGERSPNWNSYVRGMLFGLDLNHGREDLIKAAVEGITFRMYAITRALENLVGEGTEILASGGFTNSGPWLQLMADIFNKRIVAGSTPQASALGAVIMGSIAVGENNNYSDIDIHNGNEETEVFHPDPDIHKKYKQLYRLHEKVYRQNAGIYRELIDIC